MRALNLPVLLSQSISSEEKRKCSRNSSACSRPAAIRNPRRAGSLTHEELEDRRLGLAMGQIGLNHIELVKIGEQRSSSPVPFEPLSSKRSLRRPCRSP